MDPWIKSKSNQIDWAQNHKHCLPPHYWWFHEKAVCHECFSSFIEFLYSLNSIYVENVPNNTVFTPWMRTRNATFQNATWMPLYQNYLDSFNRDFLLCALQFCGCQRETKVIVSQGKEKQSFGKWQKHWVNVDVQKWMSLAKCIKYDHKERFRWIKYKNVSSGEIATASSPV